MEFGPKQTQFGWIRPGGWVRFVDPRLKQLGFSVVELSWDQDGERFRIDELVVRVKGAAITPRQWKELPLDTLLIDAATELARGASTVETDGELVSGEVAAQLQAGAHNAASRHQIPREHLEAFLKRYEAGDITQEQLATVTGKSLSTVTRYLRTAREHRRTDTSG